jgi:hypothetical protein
VLNWHSQSPWRPWRLLLRERENEELWKFPTEFLESQHERAPGVFVEPEKHICMGDIKYSHDN